MSTRSWAYGDGEGHIDGEDFRLEDQPIRDRTYESFGQQGVALPTYGDEPRPHRGAERVDLGEPVAASVAPRLPVVSKGEQHRDDRIHDNVCAHLTDDGHVDASDIDVVVHQGEVILTGTVTDARQRDRAVRVASLARGVVDVISRVRVAPARPDDGEPER